jgi:hypothetical protein
MRSASHACGAVCAKPGAANANDETKIERASGFFMTGLLLSRRLWRDDMTTIEGGGRQAKYSLYAGDDATKTACRLSRGPLETHQVSQPDLFSAVAQPLPQPDPEAVRARMTELLRRLREADVMPLTDKELRFWRTVAPQTTRWLPDDERARMLAEFEAQLDRLSRKAA